MATFATLFYLYTTVSLCSALSVPPVCFAWRDGAWLRGLFGYPHPVLQVLFQSQNVILHDFDLFCGLPVQCFPALVYTHFL